jgi:hypothetical protein
VGELVSFAGAQWQLGLVKLAGVSTADNLAVGQHDIDGFGSRLFVRTWAVHDYRKWPVHPVSAMAYWVGGGVQLGVDKVGL